MGSSRRGTLHQVAFYILAPVRQTANSKIGLRFTMGGSARPSSAPTGNSGSRAHLVDQRGMEAIVEPLTTFGAARRQGGSRVSCRSRARRAGMTTGAWMSSRNTSASLHRGSERSPGFSRSSDSRHRTRPVTVQIWPEHFDAAVEIGRPTTAALRSAGHPVTKTTPSPTSMWHRGHHRARRVLERQGIRWGQPRLCRLDRIARPCIARVLPKGRVAARPGAVVARAHPFSWRMSSLTDHGGQRDPPTHPGARRDIEGLPDAGDHRAGQAAGETAGISLAGGMLLASVPCSWSSAPIRDS